MEVVGYGKSDGSNISEKRGTQKVNVHTVKLIEKLWTGE